MVSVSVAGARVCCAAACAGDPPPSLGGCSGCGMRRSLLRLSWGAPWLRRSSASAAAAVASFESGAGCCCGSGSGAVGRCSAGCGGCCPGPCCWVPCGCVCCWPGVPLGGWCCIKSEVCLRRLGMSTGGGGSVLGFSLMNLHNIGSAWYHV